jgi:peptidoglycan/xylan/chitin deacetylase (PgdA/CDA1 family)
VDLPGRTVRRGPRGKGRIALTFDDGPNGELTRVVLDVLATYEAKATFFCVGASARAQPALIRRMVDEGHEIGNHTLDHALLTRLSKAEVHREIEGAQAAIMAAGAPRPRLFRAPKGFKSLYLPGVLRDTGLRLVGWTRGVWDTDRPGVATIVRRATPALRDGHILLLHDGLAGLDRSQTALALRDILEHCRQRGLTPVTVAQLLDMPARQRPA